jgi:hypothetical protein
MGLMKEKKSKMFFIVIVVFVFFGGLFIGYNFKDTNFYCHVDKEEVDEMYSFLGARFDDHHFGRFISENMTIKQSYEVYNTYYPFSNGVLEWELTQICD